MLWSEYAEAAMKFCKPTTLRDPMTAGLGLVSEIGELCGLAQKMREDKVIPPEKWIDEVGDVFWRIAHVAAAAGIELPEPAEPEARAVSTNVYSLDLLTQWVATAIDPSNLFVDDRWSLTGDLRKLRSRCIRLVEGIDDMYLQPPANATFEGVMESNLEKLRRRHGDAWKPHDQQNREP